MKSDREWGKEASTVVKSPHCFWSARADRPNFAITKRPGQFCLENDTTAIVTVIGQPAAGPTMCSDGQSDSVWVSLRSNWLALTNHTAGLYLNAWQTQTERERFKGGENAWKHRRMRRVKMLCLWFESSPNHKQGLISDRRCNRAFSLRI